MNKEHVLEVVNEVIVDRLTQLIEDMSNDEFVEMICFNCIGENHWRHSLTVNPLSEIEQAKRIRQTFRDWSHIYSG
jgi:hypothetical protein